MDIDHLLLSLGFVLLQFIGKFLSKFKRLFNPFAVLFFIIYDDLYFFYNDGARVKILKNFESSTVTYSVISKIVFCY